MQPHQSCTFAMRTHKSRVVCLKWEPDGLENVSSMMYNKIPLNNPSASLTICKSQLPFLGTDISTFRLRDNSVHLHECSPFLVGTFNILKRKLPCLLFDVHSVWQSTEAFVYVREKSNIMVQYCSCHFRKTQFQTFLNIYTLQNPYQQKSLQT